MAVMNPYNYQKPKNFIQRPPVKPLPENSGAIKRESRTTDKIDQYLESRIMSAKPEELTYMLYDGLVKFIKKAIIQLDDEKYEEVNYNSQRAQAILDELRSTLNMDIAMSQSLDALYEYMSYKLLMANVEKSKAFFSDALEIAEDFKATWKQAFNIKF
ncbi:flagellar export chaperone FliS [Fusibacter sp. 3D3]|uniref:flagellar export chaperone FliS n=1 Tax=Fusibacter sp. 3D3 TaxID=1048380 RepID=UPI000858DF8B|nr:flagellar export chaperone FliS [Fusibacter sp. 3D3]GAU75644.1 flagellar biosynthesis protein FliS [Fusibacter sp. 3D3]